MKSVFKHIVTRHALRGYKDQAPGAGQKILSCKVLGSGKQLTDEQLAKINRFARKPLTSEEVFHIPVLLAHNGIDRDNERFHEDTLKDFARTLVGKGFFVAGHPGGWSGSGAPGEGKYFDAAVEEMTPERFREITNEDIKLPDGETAVHALMTHAYMLKLAANEDARKNIDGGIYSFASIGFQAPYFSITDDLGNHKYGEYRPKGEALEGSLVWLGAQPGAGVTKSARAPEPSAEVEETPKGEMDPMEKQLIILGTKLGKAFKAETLADDILALFGAKDAEITRLTTENGAMKAAAEDGKAYRDSLVETTVKAAVLLGDLKNDEASQKAETDYLMTVPIDRLKVMASKADAAARKACPDQYQIPSKDQSDRKAKEQAAGTNGGRNPIVEDAQKRAEAASKK